MLKLTGFGGMMPRTSTALLPDASAVSAENVKLQSGELRPINSPKLVTAPAKAMPPLSIYHARSGATLDAWLSWPFDVDVIRAPLSVDVESRFYWTGDGEPRMGRYSDCVSGGANDYPKTYFALGIPVPTLKLAVAPSGGVGSTVTRFYCYTFFSQFGEESGSSAISESVSGKVDGTWAVSNMGAFPINSGTFAGVYGSGSTVCTATAEHWLRVGDQITIAATTLTITAVSGLTFTVLGNYSAHTGWARVANWNTSGMKRRLYRTTGTTGSWQLVAQGVGTTYSDTLTDSQILGDELISNGWVPPPTGLTGLCVHASGAVVGFVGNQLCMSEPLQPHAFIVGNQLGTDYPIVGISSFASEIAVATQGNPYIASGVEPAAMSLQKVDGLYPCMSKRSVISVGDGVIYASNHGLIYVGQSGVKVFTDSYYTRDEWLPFNPSSMICEYTNGRIYVAYTDTDSAQAVLVFDGGAHTTLGVSVSEMYADQSTGELYFGDTEGILQHNPSDTYPLSGSWRSKDFILPSGKNIGAAVIDFKTAIDPAIEVAINAQRAAALITNATLMVSPLGLQGDYGATPFNTLEINGSNATALLEANTANEVTFILRSAEDVIYSRTITEPSVFRLPAGKRYDEMSVEVIGQCAVRGVYLAETPSALKKL